MTPEPVSRPFNLGEGVRSSGGRGLAPGPRPPDAEVRALFATLPAADDGGFKLWLEGLIRTPTRPGARALAYLGEQVRAQPGSETFAAEVDKLAAEIDAGAARKEALEGLSSSLHETLISVLELGRGLGRQDVEAELAAAPVVERHVEFITDEKGRITGKREQEFRGRTRAEAGRKGES